MYVDEVTVVVVFVLSECGNITNLILCVSDFWSDRTPLHEAAFQGRLLHLRALIAQVTLNLDLYVEYLQSTTRRLLEKKSYENPLISPCRASMLTQSPWTGSRRSTRLASGVVTLVPSFFWIMEQM